MTGNKYKYKKQCTYCTPELSYTPKILKLQFVIFWFKITYYSNIHPIWLYIYYIMHIWCVSTNWLDFPFYGLIYPSFLWILSIICLQSLLYPSPFTPTWEVLMRDIYHNLNLAFTLGLPLLHTQRRCYWPIITSSLRVWHTPTRFKVVLIICVISWIYKYSYFFSETKTTTSVAKNFNCKEKFIHHEESIIYKYVYVS